MLQELAGKLPDIVIGLVGGMVTGLACLLIDRASKGREPPASQPQQVTLTHITKVSVDIATRQPKAAGVDPFAVMGVLAGSIAYLRNQDAVLMAALWGATFLLGVWFIVTVYSLYAGHVAGLRWPTYLLLMIAVLTIGTFSVVPAAFNPAALPPVRLPFDQWQAFALDYGAKSMFALLGWNGVAWLAVHVFGMAVFLWALKDAALSMMFYAAAGSGRLQRADESSWLVRLAARYARPFRMLVWLALSMLLAYWCVDGTLLQWWTEEMPPMLNRFMHEVMSGRRAG